MQFLLHHDIILEAILSRYSKALKSFRENKFDGWVLASSIPVIYSRLSGVMDDSSARKAVKQAMAGIPLLAQTGSDIVENLDSGEMEYLESLAAHAVKNNRLDGLITLHPEKFEGGDIRLIHPDSLDELLRKERGNVEKVPLLDIPATYPKIWNDVEQEMAQVTRSGRFILGQKVAELEEQIAAYCQATYAVGVSSGTDALLLALMAADIGPGDEVITSPYTFFATAGSIARVGAKPVMVDIDPYTYNMDVEKIEAAITEKTRALMPVHIFGQCVDMPPLLKVAEKHNLKIIEDAAQAIGSEYLERRAGSMGDFGCFSFFPTKNLGGFGDAGMVTTSTREYYEKLKMLRVHGMEPKYYHKAVGGNFRIDELQAAVILAKLIHLEDWTEKRRNNAQRYLRIFQKEMLAEHFELPMEIFPRHIYNQYVVRVKNGKRDALQNHLRENNVACEIYYPVPLHTQECFQYLGYRKGDLPEAERAAEETLALPIAPEITAAQQDYVAEKIKEFYS